MLWNITLGAYLSLRMPTRRISPLLFHPSWIFFKDQFDYIKEENLHLENAHAILQERGYRGAPPRFEDSRYHIPPEQRREILDKFKAVISESPLNYSLFPQRFSFIFTTRPSINRVINSQYISINSASSDILDILKQNISYYKIHSPYPYRQKILEKEIHSLIRERGIPGICDHF